MTGIPNYDGYFEAPAEEWIEEQMTAEKIAEKFQADELEDLAILDTVYEQATIHDVYKWTDEDGTVILVEWSYSEWESPGERVSYSGTAELEPSEKFNVMYR